MQSLHYNSGSIKLTRERSTMVSRWETPEVARWIEGLAGIEPKTGDIFLKHSVDGTALSLLLREDLIRMGIKKLDQQLILMQSIDLLLTLTNRLSSETLALLFMQIHCAATTCYNLLKRTDVKDAANNNSNVLNSPEFFASISKLSDVIVVTCHWLGRLPFIEDINYIELRRKIIKVLVQIRVLIRSLRVADQINMPKAKLILEINELRISALTLVRQNKDSLFSSDCYLTRVHLRRPPKNDVNIEYTTLPDFTHVISSIETEAMSFLGSGFSAINIGDEIIEINSQVVIGWDPQHFDKLLSSSSQTNEICLLVKKMPRHNDDEVYTKRLIDLPHNPRRSRTRGALERRQQKAKETQTILLAQEGEIEIESDDETLYQSKRTSQIKRDQHSSLPDLTETLTNTENTLDNNRAPDTNETSSSSPSTSRNPFMSSMASNKNDREKQSKERPKSANGSHSTPKSPKKTGYESCLFPFLRSRHDSKSVIADTNNHPSKDHPQLLHYKRIESAYNRESSNNSTTSLHDDQISSSPPAVPGSPMNKSASQASLQNAASSLHSSLSNIFKLSDSSEKNRTKRSTGDAEKPMTFRNELKTEICSIFNSFSSNNSNNNTNVENVVTNKPPISHSDNRKNSISVERRRPKRSPSYKRISCKDLGKGDCEGFLYRYVQKGTISFVPWKLYWCVLKGGTLYVFKSKDDKNQQLEIKLEGKNVSPAPERRKYGFRVSDETNKDAEYFYCSNRDEMAKWMNKMGLAAINFNIDDSKIGGFHKGFVQSHDESPVATPIIGSQKLFYMGQRRTAQKSSFGDSENDSDKESIASWQKSMSHNSSVSDLESFKNASNNNNINNNKQTDTASGIPNTRSSSSNSLMSLPDSNLSSTKLSGHPLTRHLKETSFGKGHHRTNSSPIKFLSTYDRTDQDNVYVKTAPRMSDSECLNDEIIAQRTFINSNVLNENKTEEAHQSPKQYQSLMLTSSGGFSTPTATPSSTCSENIPTFYSPQMLPSAKPPSHSSVFFLPDEEIPSLSSRSASFCFERPNSLSEDTFSPMFSTERLSPSVKNSKQPPLNSSSSSLSQPHSSTTLRTTPVLISINSSTPPTPIVKTSVSSSTSQANDDHVSFVGRLPSSELFSIRKQDTDTLAQTNEHDKIPSHVNIHQQ